MLGYLPAILSESTLSLSPEEVFALLEMCTLTLVAEGPNHLRVLNRLTNLYRDMIRQEARGHEMSSEDRAPVSSQCRPAEGLTVACLY